jgi:hypothetical protein
MTSREAIFAALFAQISTATGFVTTSRTLLHWTDVPPQNQPALFQSEGKQRADTVRGQPTKWMFEAELAIYVHAASLPPGVTDVVSVLNAQIDAVIAALARDPVRGVQTLNGVVGDVRIQGEVVTDEGRLGQQAVALIPLEIQPLT